MDKFEVIEDRLKIGSCEYWKDLLWFFIRKIVIIFKSMCFKRVEKYVELICMV